MYLPLICFIATAIIRFFVLSKVKSSQLLSPQAKQLHQRFAKAFPNSNQHFPTIQMLLIQACCPLIVGIASVLTTFVEASTNAPAVLGSLSFALMGTTQIIDALTVLFIVPHHKAIIHRYFGSNKTQPLFTTSSSIQLIPRYSTNNSVY